MTARKALGAMSENQQLGQLPASDRADELEELSDRALRNAFPIDRFRVRTEPGKDRGADRYVEAKLSGHDTNCRAQLQLKGTDTGRANADGSISLSVDVSNLNYLLNGPSPLYVLWIAPLDELRYVWARDERHRLDHDSPNWMSQGTVVLRFQRRIDPTALDAIHDRILREAQLDRRVHEILIRVGSSERVVLGVDPTTLECTDPHEIYERIASVGMALVSAGFGQAVLDSIELLNPEARSDATVQLVAGYAHASLSCFQAALGPLTNAATKCNSLSSTDQQFLDRIRVICNFRVGILDESEYTTQYGDLARAQGGAVLADHQLETVRQIRLHERDERRRAELLVSMQRHSAEIQSSSDASAAQKLQAKVIVMSAEGDGIAARAMVDMTHVEMRRAMGYSAAAMQHSATETAKANWDAWQRQASSLLDEALALGHPILSADAISARLGVLLGVLQMRRVKAFLDDVPWAPPADQIYRLMQEAEQALAIYSRVGSVQGECAAKLFLADLFDLLDQRQPAQSLAEAVLPIADAFNLVRQAENAREYIEGPTMFEALSARVREARGVDDDFLLAGAGDDDVRRFARDSWESLQIPANRLPIVERDCFASRTIARERVDWCRHLQLQQDLTHTHDPITCYRSDPNRRCLCEKHGYASAIENPDTDVVIRAFKDAYCERCGDRNPKRNSGE